MFSGSLSDLNLAQILDLLHASNQSGELVLAQGSHRVGSIYLHLGQLTHAQVDQFEGLDALNRIVSCVNGTFRFDAGILPVEQSLAAYPSDRLLDRIRKQLDIFKQALASLPPIQARPVYQPVSGPMDIQTTSQELGLLVLANGQRTIAEIAQLAGVSTQFAAEAMAKFQQSNLIKMAESGQVSPAVQSFGGPAQISSAPPAASSPPSPKPPDVPAKPVRYWRGRPIT